MLIAFVLWLFHSVESFKLKDANNVSIVLKPGDKVALKASADYWFKSCTLKDNLQQTICTTTLSKGIPYSPSSDCNGNFAYKGDGTKFICQMEIQNVQKQGKDF